MLRVVLFAATYLSLLPCMILCVGAARKVWVRSHRIARLQLEGAAIVLAGLVLRLVMFDAIFGFDPAREGRFAFWFARGEQGLLTIGTILFALGFFLERRPRPGLAVWPVRYIRTAWACAGAGAMIALVIAWRGYAPCPMPWTLSRTSFLLGLTVFAVIYAYMAFMRPDDAAQAEKKIIGIEE